MPEPCGRCGEPVPDGSRFCTTCGHPVNGAAATERDAGGANVNAPTVRLGVCPACEAVCDADGNFCDNCGAALGDAELRPQEGGTPRGRSTSPAGKAAKAGGKTVMFCSACKLFSDDAAAVFCEDCGASSSRPRAHRAMESRRSSKARCGRRPARRRPRNL
ncbi:hypothetical protein STCU_10707 [Strigomonas culicis]|uniref:DZANK-type domain-containing protein n=1 Tax=Strigomonas culicis TaxID=28005 RepID=S9V369_9TRYP|nr:hypothetical protein STCU_10707 [Strigomonas culicis]|eukprot:EPY17280.1 hypothetical protein STCU_10707 [Strigomonas culicis]